LEQFGLEDASNNPISQFSGGMRRRLDLAASLITRSPGTSSPQTRPISSSARTGGSHAPRELPAAPVDDRREQVAPASERPRAGPGLIDIGTQSRYFKLAVTPY
jgi:hypothetical protein